VIADTVLTGTLPDLAAPFLASRFNRADTAMPGTVGTGPRLAT
jgi:hypothetical protein